MITTKHTVILTVSPKSNHAAIHMQAHAILGKALTDTVKECDLVLGETVIINRASDLIPYTLVEVSVTWINSKARLASKTNPQ